MNDRVLIVGVGGLGVPAAIAAVRHGVRRLTLIDPDPVELSNLARQIIYRMSDIGLAKTDTAARHLRDANPGLEVETLTARFEPSNAAQIVPAADFVIDATDDPPSKFLINDACLAAAIPFVYGGVLGLNGQAMTVIPGKTACLRCLFETPPELGDAASCRDAGIIGPVAGAIGCLQGLEAARWITKHPLQIAGAIFIYEGTKAFTTRLKPVNRRTDCGCGAARRTGVATPMAVPVDRGGQ